VNKASAPHLQANEFKVFYRVHSINLSNYFSPEKALPDFSWQNIFHSWSIFTTDN